MKQFLLFVSLLFLSSSVFAQNATISGTVTSQSDGLPIIGATVVLQGTTTAVGTDVNGEYTIKVPTEGAVLVFAYAGFITREIEVNTASNTLNVELSEDVTQLEEIVVIGYGTTKKKLVTGANLNVKGEDIAKLNTTSAMEALQGTAAGVTIDRENGAPGSSTNVVIRGLGTVGNSAPLYIVDGVEVGNIDYLNPQSIESIDVLKDAASAAIYGSKAANGVILVTTKKGKVDQKTQVSYSGYVGFQNLANQPSFLNAQEYMYIQDEMKINDGLAANDWLSLLSNNSWLDGQSSGLGSTYGEYIWGMLEDGWEGTDWLDEILSENAKIQSHSVTITGGGSKSTYSLGAGYYRQEGLVGGDVSDAYYERFNTNINTEFILWEKDDRKIVTFGENLNYTYTTSKYVATGNQYWNDVYNAGRTTPIMPAYWDESPDESGIAPNLDGLNQAHTNPLGGLYWDRGQFTDGGSNNITGNAYLNISPIEGLNIRSSFGVNASFSNSRSYSPVHTGFGNLSTGTVTDNVSQGAYQYTSYTWSNTINYAKTIDKHSFSVLLGQETQGTFVDMGVGASAKGSLYSSLDNAYLANVPTPSSVADMSYWGYDWAAGGGGVLSFMGRFSYSYDDKYMVDFTMRADGSSNFAPGNQWGYFPSISAGWNFTEEEFMQDVNWLSSGKLRASWGQNGNQTLMDSDGNYVSFVYTSNVTSTDLGYYFGDNKLTAATSSYPSNVSNEDISWETSEQLNIGLDLGFFDSRLGFTFDWYKKTTKDWLVISPIQGTYGASAPFVNGGEIVNAGTEWTLRWKDNVGDFSYGAAVSIFTNKNEVTALDADGGYISGPTSQIYDNCDAINRVEVGMPIGYFYGYQTDGILQNQSEVDAYVNSNGDAYFSDAKPGDVRFVDVNGDGVIDDNDKTMIGDPNPDVSLGLSLNFGYKGAFLNVTASGEFGMQVFNSYFWGHGADNNSYRNWTTQIFDRWTGEGTSNTLPILSSSGHRNSSYISDLYVYDADYLRITNLTVGYDFATLLKKQTWASNISLYVSVNNLYTFTGYEGYDPNVSYGGDGCSWGSGVDLGYYATPRTVMIGLNLTF